MSSGGEECIEETAFLEAIIDPISMDSNGEEVHGDPPYLSSEEDEEHYRIVITVFREGAPATKVKVAQRVALSHTQSSWMPLIRKVERVLDIGSVEGLYTEYGLTPVCRIVSLENSGVYAARPTANCALVRSLVLDTTEVYPAWPIVEEGRLARVKLAHEINSTGGLLGKAQEMKKKMEEEAKRLAAEEAALPPFYCRVCAKSFRNADMEGKHYKFSTFHKMKLALRIECVQGKGHPAVFMLGREPMDDKPGWNSYHVSMISNTEIAAKFDPAKGSPVFWGYSKDVNELEVMQRATEAASVPGILEAMTMHSYLHCGTTQIVRDRRVQKHGLRALANLCMREERHRAGIIAWRGGEGHCNGVELILRVLDQFRDDSRVVRYGCWLFSHLPGKLEPEKQRHIADVGGLDVLTFLLRKHHRDAAIVQQALAGIWGLVEGNPRNCVYLAAEGKDEADGFYSTEEANAETRSWRLQDPLDGGLVDEDEDLRPLPGAAPAPESAPNDEIEVEEIPPSERAWKLGVFERAELCYKLQQEKALKAKRDEDDRKRAALATAAAAGEASKEEKAEAERQLEEAAAATAAEEERLRVRREENPNGWGIADPYTENFPWKEENVPSRVLQHLMRDSPIKNFLVRGDQSSFGLDMVPEIVKLMIDYADNAELLRYLLWIALEFCRDNDGNGSWLKRRLRSNGGMVRGEVIRTRFYSNEEVKSLGAQLVDCLADRSAACRQELSDGVAFGSASCTLQNIWVTDIGGQNWPAASDGSRGPKTLYPGAAKPREAMGSVPKAGDVFCRAKRIGPAQKYIFKGGGEKY